MISRDDAAGVQAGDPIFLSPDYGVDPLLGLYVQSATFRKYPAETKRNYATDIALLLTFLWGRGRAWTGAAERDLEDYEHWRRLAPGNPDRIGGAKWDRGLAAFASLYGWAAKNGHVTRNPVAMKQVRGRNGEVVTTPAARAKDARPEYLLTDGQGGLLVRHHDREGRVREYDFAQLPVPAPMRASLAALFAARCTPDRWSAHDSSEQPWLQLRRFAQFLASQEPPPRDLEELTPAMVRRWRAWLPAGAGGYYAFGLVSGLLLDDSGFLLICLLRFRSARLSDVFDEVSRYCESRNTVLPEREDYEGTLDGVLIRNNFGPPGFFAWGRQVARRRTSQMVAAASRIASRSSPPPSMPWNGQYRLAGW